MAACVSGVVPFVGLVSEQREVLVDLCLCWGASGGASAPYLCKVSSSREGARGGMVRNPWTPVCNQYRAHFRSLAGELSLTPSAASRLTPTVGGRRRRPVRLGPVDRLLGGYRFRVRVRDEPPLGAGPGAAHLPNPLEERNTRTRVHR